jgi:hypothetical protein
VRKLWLSVEALLLEFRFLLLILLGPPQMRLHRSSRRSPRAKPRTTPTGERTMQQQVHEGETENGQQQEPEPSRDATVRA